MSQTCTCVLKTGPHTGEVCGKRAAINIDGSWYCGRHIPSNRPSNVLCEYLPNGLPLSDFELFDVLITPNLEMEDKIKCLNGYINIRIRYPILAEGHVPLVLFTSRVSGNIPFTRKLLAKHLLESIEYVVSRPDVYNLSRFSLAEMKLTSITYDLVSGLFDANIDVIS